MAYKYDEEFHGISPKSEYLKIYEDSMPADERMPVSDIEPIKESMPDEEFMFRNKVEENDSKLKSRKRRDRIKYNFLQPVTAALMTVTIINSSYGMDPLGHDVFSDEPHPYYFEHNPHYYEEPDDYFDDIEVPVGIITTYYHVEYVPNHEVYDCVLTDEDGYEDIREWVDTMGGDPDNMVRVNIEYTFTGYVYSDDTIYVGDPDNPENAYIPRGEQYKTYRCDVYYKAYEYGTQAVKKNVFPTLDNLEPDFAGDYAWGQYGVSEEFVRIGNAYDEVTYLVCGDAWQNMGYEAGTVSGAEYDSDTNTLTLRNFTGEIIETNLMGNGFKIELVGDNYITGIVLWGAMYGGSVTFTGTGNLNIVNNDGYGIYINAENSESCMMVEKGVTIDIHTSAGAIRIEDTLLREALYLDDGVNITGGKGQILNGVKTSDDRTVYLYSVTEGVSISKEVVISSK